jgi:hypothetical protein
LSESSATRGFERTRSASTSVTATLSAAKARALAWGVASLVGRGETATADDGWAEEMAVEAAGDGDGVGVAGAVEATDAEQPDITNSTPRSAAGVRRVVPRIVSLRSGCHGRVKRVMDRT